MTQGGVEKGRKESERLKGEVRRLETETAQATYPPPNGALFLMSEAPLHFR